jgi:hypothetical protein
MEGREIRALGTPPRGGFSNAYERRNRLSSQAGSSPARRRARKAVVSASVVIVSASFTVAGQPKRLSPLPAYIEFACARSKSLCGTFGTPTGDA